jgi:hypothetical protein
LGIVAGSCLLKKIFALAILFEYIAAQFQFQRRTVHEMVRGGNPNAAVSHLKKKNAREEIRTKAKKLREATFSTTVSKVFARSFTTAGATGGGKRKVI